jgi:signal peptidase I
MMDPYNPPPKSDRGCFSFSCGCCSGGCLVGVLLIAISVLVFAYGYWVGMIEHPGEYGYVQVLNTGMSPTIQQGDWILVDRGHYAQEEVKRGDIVLFVPPGESNEPDTKQFLRVAGLAGESVSFDATGELMINGTRLTRDIRFSERDYRLKGKPPEPVSLGENQYYLLGDDRADARDSRKFGPVEMKNLRGRAVSILFPPQRVERIDRVK